MIKELELYISAIAKYYNVQYENDYKQEVLLVLFEKGEVFLHELHKSGLLKLYCSRVCRLMLHGNSVYYRKYIKPHKGVFELNGSASTIKKEKVFNENNLLEMINSLSGNDKTLMEHYILCRGKKLNLSKKSNISYSTICKMLQNLNEKIKQRYDIDDFYD